MELTREDLVFPDVPKNKLRVNNDLIDFDSEINEYVPPQLNEYVPPQLNEYVPPQLNEYVPSQLNEYVPPQLNEYLPPQLNEYVPPIVPAQYVPPQLNEYVPPIFSPQYVPPIVPAQYVSPQIPTAYVPPKHEGYNQTENYNKKLVQNNELEDIMNESELEWSKDLDRLYDLAKRLDHRFCKIKIARTIIDHMINKLFSVNLFKKAPNERIYDLLIHGELSYSSVESVRKKLYPKFPPEEFYKNLCRIGELPIKQDYERNFKEMNPSVNVIDLSSSTYDSYKDVRILQNERRLCYVTTQNTCNLWYIDTDGILCRYNIWYGILPFVSIKYYRDLNPSKRYIDIICVEEVYVLLNDLDEIILGEKEKVIKFPHNLNIRYLEHFVYIRSHNTREDNFSKLILYCKVEDEIKVYSMTKYKYKDVTHKYLPRNVKMVLSATAFVLNDDTIIQVIKEDFPLSELIKNNKFIQRGKYYHNPPYQIYRIDNDEELLFKREYVEFKKNGDYVIKPHVIYKYDEDNNLKLISCYSSQRKTYDDCISVDVMNSVDVMSSYHHTISIVTK